MCPPANSTACSRPRAATTTDRRRKTAPTITRTRPAPPAVQIGADVYASIEDRVQVPRVYDAWHTVKAFADSDATLDVLAIVLAGGRSSRLYKRLVYELQIATDAVAFQDGGRIDGKFELWATARPGHDLTELERVIDEEIGKIAQAGPTPREVERAQNSFEAQFLSRMERVGGFGGKADQLNFYNYFVGTPDYFEKDLDRYRKVTAADVQQAARHYLVDAHRVVRSEERRVGKGGGDWGWVTEAEEKPDVDQRWPR